MYKVHKLADQEDICAVVSRIIAMIDLVVRCMFMRLIEEDRIMRIRVIHDYDY